jgi:iron-sulfur cluster repair protein YtfE (RIC family)
MTAFEATPETEQGRALFEELIWIHGMIRHDLTVVQQLAVNVISNLSPEEVHAEIARLRTNGPLWQLKVNCLRYCRFVHSHHNLEDAAFFPALRQANPALAPVVDKLEADHRAVSDLLDAVEESADVLTKVDSDAVRRAVADALDALAAELLAHLEYEELNAGPTIRRLQLL